MKHLLTAALLIVLMGCTKEEKQCFTCKTTVKMDYSAGLPDATSSVTEQLCEGDNGMDIEAYKKARTSKTTATATANGYKVTVTTTSTCNCTPQ